MKNKEEGWVKFVRYSCKEGHIDRWTGDCINNPNNPTKSSLQLNSFVTYWRCNDSEWIHANEIGRNNIYSLLEMREEFTAQEIWENLLNK